MKYRSYINENTGTEVLYRTNHGIFALYGPDSSNPEQWFNLSEKEADDYISKHPYVVPNKSVEEEQHDNQQMINWATS